MNAVTRRRAAGRSPRIDLSINLTRLPVGEWILLDAETWLDRGGGGIAFARMADMAGYFGRGVQSLVVERR
jgi:hypothetical protein